MHRTCGPLCLCECVCVYISERDQVCFVCVHMGKRGEGVCECVCFLMYSKSTSSLCTAEPFVSSLSYPQSITLTDSISVWTLDGRPSLYIWLVCLPLSFPHSLPLLLFVFLSVFFSDFCSFFPILFFAAAAERCMVFLCKYKEGTDRIACHSSPFPA